MTTIKKLENPGYSNFIEAHHYALLADPEFWYKTGQYHPFENQEAMLVDPDWFNEERMAKLIEHGLDSRQLLACIVPLG